MPTAAVTVGVIGAGQHVRDMLLPPLQTLKAVSLRAVCTASGITAKTIAERVQAGYCTSDVQAVLSDGTINTVLIGTRHDSHGPLVVRALEAGKHVFVEKPLCLTEDELAAIREAYAKQADRGLQLLVGFNRRFAPHAETARKFFARRQNPLTMLYRINAGRLPKDHWAQDARIGGGRIVGEVCHFVDYMQALCGAGPTTVSARRIGRHTSGVTDDQCTLALTFADGSIGTILYTAAGERGLAKEYFEAHADGRSLVMHDFQETHCYADGKHEVVKTAKREKGFQEELTRFVHAVERGLPPVMAFAEIEAVTRTCLLAVQSLQTGSSYEL